MNNDFAAPLTAGALDYVALRNALVKRVIYPLASTEDPQTFTALTGAAVPLGLAWGGALFWLDPADHTSAHDGVTVLKTLDDYRYKILAVSFGADSVLSATVTTPPASPSIDDTYLVPAGATGAWASHQDDIAKWTANGWQFEIPAIGRWLLIEDVDGYMRYSTTGWKAGPGANALQANSVPLSAIVNVARHAIVEDQVTLSPPGSRITGGTPTAPLGGTAANFNDNTLAATCTATPGNLSAVSSAGSRIVARLDLGSAQVIRAIQGRAISCSTGASTAGCGFYTSTDGTTWTLFGTTFNISTTPTDYARSGTVTARYVAFVTSQEAWGSATNTIADLNVYGAGITASVGTAYIVGDGAVGQWLGKDKQLAICEVANTFTFYAPSAGWAADDKARGGTFRYNGSAWISAIGSIVDTASAKYTGTTGFSTVIPIDDSIPQNIEGDLVLSKTYTMKSTTNILRIRLSGMMAHNTAGQYGGIALFQDSIANALKAGAYYFNSALAAMPVLLEHEYVPGTVSPITITVRAGPGGSGIIAFNGNYNARFFGGISALQLILEEVAAS